MPMNLFRKLPLMPNVITALPGRASGFVLPSRHLVLRTPLQAPFPAGLHAAMFGLGCFWGAERHFWQTTGVYCTRVGYAGGFTPNPTYEEVCSGRTGHAEVVSVIYDPQSVSYEQLLKGFWETHDPTQGRRQGNDVGTQYRSAICALNATQHALAVVSLRNYQAALSARGFGRITTQVLDAPVFFPAEDYHQQYLDKNPNGYCGSGGCGVPYETLLSA
ncbi:MAG: peptide-methionine (S)-S-oxide reductase MsrA [Steroidobacteraceae bacterium]